MAFTLRQLQYFIAVAEQGTVSGAAQSLSISQSAVTEAIKELEGDLGVDAVRAASARPVDHPQGPPVPPARDQILADVSDARRTFSPTTGPPAPGALQLGVTSLVAGYVLSDLLARYRRAYPAVDVSAIEDNGDYLEHLLIGGELDVAVMVISNLRDRMALQAEILEVSPYRLWLPLGHRLASADIIGVSDIAAEPLIMLTVDEIEENTGKLLCRARRPAACRLPHPLGGGGSQPCRHRRRHRAAAGPRLPPLVARRRPHRVPRRVGSLPVVQVGIVWRRGSRLPRRGTGFHRHGAGPAGRPACGLDIGISDIALLTNEIAKSGTISVTMPWACLSPAAGRDGSSGRNT